ncbi:MAG: CoB--CoM heterodisulfide reductase iron-sulfur subunit A family protein [Bacteroidales bacterium]|nr:MAG: CoB--CoM heterodisulfide reductase iron-sulfur subunit A family protein [Bacteroidales bacterium]
MSKTVAIIGGGIAGLETSIQLEKLGYDVTLYEKDKALGGHAGKWDRLFPNRRHATEVIDSLTSRIKDKVQINLAATVNQIKRENGSFLVEANGKSQKADAIVLTTGFELFPANKKEEYGYGIFENVITSAELESMFSSNGKPLMTNGNNPAKVAFIHCVGSRDEKVNRPYCSKVCCVTAVKQAIEVKEAIPTSDVYCFYMDLRMFGPGYEDLYKEAQVKGVNFIRGRLSETSEMEGGRVLIKAEDTLSSKPLKMTVDMVVLMVGMSPLPSTEKLLKDLEITPNNDGFVQVKDYHLEPTHTEADGVFVAGACTGPNNITDSVNAAHTAALEVHKYLTSE